MKILLLGADGQLGFSLRQSLSNSNQLLLATRSGFLQNGTPCLKTDLLNQFELQNCIESNQPDWVINAAAYTAVDKAEAEAELAHAINADALSVIGVAAKKIGASVLHYSSDYVFAGDANAPYNCDAPVAPINQYGLSKLQGEINLRASSVNHLIVRTQWVYAAHGSNFLRTMLRLGRDRSELRVVNDQVGSPTAAHLIAAVSAKIVAHPMAKMMRETLHLASAGTCTWFEFAEQIFAAAARRNLLQTTPLLVPISTQDYPTPARRPAYSVLATEKLREIFSLELPSWQIGLSEVFDQLVTTHHTATGV